MSGVCSAVMKGEVEKVVFSSSNIKERICLRPESYPVCLEKEAIIDINNDGVLEKIGFWSKDSGAGCGARYEWLRESSSVGKSINASGLDNVLFNEATGPIPSKLDNEEIFTLQIIKFDGKSYIISKSKSGNSARVFNLSGVTLNVSCEFDIYPEHYINNYYAFE